VSAAAVAFGLAALCLALVGPRFEPALPLDLASMRLRFRPWPSQVSVLYSIN
jgi:hypothetical protein